MKDPNAPAEEEETIARGGPLSSQALARAAHPWPSLAAAHAQRHTAGTDDKSAPATSMDFGFPKVEGGDGGADADMETISPHSMR